MTTTPAIPAHINSLDRLSAATHYSSALGWAVHPLQPPDRGDERARGKKPLMRGWPQHTAAEITPEFLSRSFGPGTRNNLGCVVRPPFVHIDLDSKPDGGASVVAWLAGVPELASVPRERTGGGVHLVFLCRDLPPDILAAKKAPVSQITGTVTAELYKDGLNIVLSPSVHPGGHQYTWEVTGPIPEVRWADLVRWFGFAEPEAPARRGRPAKDKPWWAAWQHDLRTLDLPAVMQALGHPCECIDPDEGKWSVACPWANGHSGEQKPGGTDTVFFSKPETMPGFRCLHAHCAEKGIRELVLWAEEKRPGIIAAHCTDLRVWSPGSTGKNSRPRVVLPNTGRPHGVFGEELGTAAAPSLHLFRYSGSVVEIVHVPAASSDGDLPGHMLHALKPTHLVTSIERAVETGILDEDDAGDTVFLPRSMSESDARVTLVSGQFLAKLPVIQRLIDVPVPMPGMDGELLYPSTGYDPRFGTWLDPQAPPIRTMGLDEALELILEELFPLPENGGFWWHDEQARTHAIARFLTPMCRGLMKWRRTPLWIFDGNREGCGKDTCANVAHLVYTGAPVICAPLSKDCDEEMRKRITSALMQGSRYFHLANMKGHVRYASLEAATDDSGIWEDRRLGASETLRLPNETEYSFSANNATWEPDIERRCRRIRLRFCPEHVNAHRYRHADIRQWLTSMRQDLVSAAAALVTHWVRMGSPAGPSPFASFPVWGRVVGGVMHACGLGDPCLPHEESQSSGDQNTQAMRKFYVLAFERFGDTEIIKARFQEFVQQESAVHDIFEWIDFTQRRGLIAFGKLVTKFDGRELCGITFRIRQTSRNWSSYQFQRVAGYTVPDIATNSPDGVGCQDVLGCFSHARIGENKSEEKNKKSGELNVLYRGVGKTSLDILTSHKPTSAMVIHTSRRGVERAADDLRGAGRIALDIETFGPRKGDGLNPWRGEIRLLTLRKEEGTVHVIDLVATGYDLGPLREVLEESWIIAHNAKFDLLWLRVKCGLNARQVWCTLTAARLLTAGTRPGNSLDKCLERYLDVPPGPDHSLSDWGSMLLTEEQIAYAVADVSHLHALLAVLERELTEAGLEGVHDMESSLLPVIIDMEERGVHVSRERLTAIATEARAQESAALVSLRDALGVPALNAGSPKQLLAALASAGIVLESTAEEALKAADDGRIIPLILAHREASKRAQQAESLIGHIERDGRIHSGFDQTGTATGRFSSRDPNLQNVGRGELRAAFTAPEGRRLVVADYSQIELRAAAAIAGETKMIEAYRNGADLHRLTAATVLGKPESEVTKEERQMSKACFSGDTEILTERGWVRFDEYDGSTPVAQYTLPAGMQWNPPRVGGNRWGPSGRKVHFDGGGHISFTSPVAFMSFEDRELFHHRDRNTDLLVTGDHEIAFITNAGNPAKVPALEVSGGNCRKFIAAATLARRRFDERMEAFTRTLAMVVADGYFSSSRCVRFGFSKQRKVERCLRLLGELGLEPRVSTSGRVTTIAVSHPEWVETLLSWITVKKDLSWRCLTELPADVYLDEAAYWDGSLNVGEARSRVLFTTTSTQTAHVMQAMAATSGMPSMLKLCPSTVENHADLWLFSYVLEGTSTWRASWNLQPTGRRERVWCVQVPSGAILIRRNGKVCVQGNCNFGLIYGQSSPGLVRYAASAYGVTMEEEEAQRIRSAFFRTYSRLRQWHGTSHNAAADGVTEVRTRSGRRRLIPETASEWERFTALVNTPVQGGTADGMKLAIIRAGGSLPEGAFLVSTVHDELVAECREEDAEAVKAIIMDCMIRGMGTLFGDVPVEVEASVCSTWGDK